MNIEFNEIPDWVCQVEPNQLHLGWYENEVGNSVRLGKGVKKLDWLATLTRHK